MSGHWPAAVVRAWQVLGTTNCAHCGLVINTHAPKMIKSRRNPMCLAIAHKVTVKEARLMGWTTVRIYSRENSLPVHQTCAPRLVRSGTRPPPIGVPRLAREGTRVSATGSPVQDDQADMSGTQVNPDSMIESRW
jgi:hypothetical protein